MVHKIRDLTAKTREIVEGLIGRPMREDESFSIRPLYLQKEGPDAATANAVADELDRYFAEVDAQHPPVSEEEAADAIDEAMRHIRPGYTSIR